MRTEHKSVEGLNLLLFLKKKRERVESSTQTEFHRVAWLTYYFLPDALVSLKEVSESACPNDGFLDQVRFAYDVCSIEFPGCLSFSLILHTLQLKLFEEMGFKVDTSSPLYKRFRLKLLG
jgi:hypothetical protein